MSWAETAAERLLDAERHLVRGLALCRRTGQRNLRASLLKTLGDVQIRLGRLEAALSTLDEAMSNQAHGETEATANLVAAARAQALLWLEPTHERAVAVAQAVCRRITVTVA